MNLAEKIVKEAIALLNQPDSVEKCKKFAAKMMLNFRYEEQAKELSNADLAKMIEDKCMGDIGMFSLHYCLLSEALDRLDPSRLESDEQISDEPCGEGE